MWRYRRFSVDSKCLILILALLLFKSKKCASQFHREIVIENKQFTATKTWLSNTYLIRVFRVAVVNRALPYLHEWKLEVTVSVSLTVTAGLQKLVF